MKNKTIRIWGIVLTLVILAGLLIVPAVPASAGNLSWTNVSIPSVTGNVLVASTGPWVMDGAADGKTFFAYDGALMYKTTDGGLTFTASTSNPFSGPLVALAVSPDFANDRVVVAATASTVYYSGNGGSSFSAIGSIGTTLGAGTITSVDVSPYYSGGIGVLVGTKNAGAGNAYLLVTGGITATFQAQNIGADVYGVSFSPNQRIDGFMTFVSANASGVFVNTKWAGTAVNNQYLPATITTADLTASLVKASYAYPADFDKDSNDFFFVGLNDAAGDVYRVHLAVGTPGTATDMNAAGAAPSSTNVESLSFRGNAADGYLYVGLSNSASIRRATGTMASSVSFFGSSRLSGASNTFVFASPAAGDSNIYAMTTGTGAAFQVSTDNAATFNLLSLIGGSTSPMVNDLLAIDANTMFAVLDIAGTKLFKTSNAGTNWQGIYWPASGSIAKVYASPTYSTDNTLYLTYNSTVLSRSTNGGTSFVPILNGNSTATSAFAAVDASTFYAGATNTIYKGGTQGTKSVTGMVTSIDVINASTVAVATNAGNVYLSTDSGSTFTMLGTSLGAGNTYVQADSAYATNSNLYVAKGTSIYTWTVGTTTAWPTNPSTAGGNVNGLMQGSEGTIYAGTDAGVARSIDSYAVIPGNTAASMVVSVAASGTPALPANTIIAILVGTSSVKTFQDTLVVAPATTGPAANASVNLPVVFTWGAVAAPAGKLYDYKAEVSTTANFAPGTTVATLTTNNGITTVSTTGALQPGGTYYWRVQVTGWNFGTATAATMASKKSAAVKFGVKLNQNPNDIFQLLAPGPAATDVARTPTFQWSPVNGATGYDLQVSDNPVFVNPIDSQTNLATTVWTLTKTLDYDTVYYWRVRSQNSNTGVVGDWVSQAFTTEAVPATTPPPPTTPPASTTTVTVTPTLPPITLTVPPGETPTPATPAYIWVIIAIGAVLVIAVIVLIARTRRV